jgi:hypothetical protein
MAKRLSVILNDEDVRTMDEFADPKSLAHGVLVRWLTEQGVTISPDTVGDDALLHMLMRVGAEALRERAIAEGYAVLADAYDEGDAESRLFRDRHAQRADGLYDE